MSDPPRAHGAPGAHGGGTGMHAERWAGSECRSASAHTLGSSDASLRAVPLHLLHAQEALMAQSLTATDMHAALLLQGQRWARVLLGSWARLQPFCSRLGAVSLHAVKGLKGTSPAMAALAHACEMPPCPRPKP
jgi:hypothetical protein